jgi:hypothetical protein
MYRIFDIGLHESVNLGGSSVTGHALRLLSGLYQLPLNGDTGWSVRESTAHRHPFRRSLAAYIDSYICLLREYRLSP